jgi:hypothetical protein
MVLRHDGAEREKKCEARVKGEKVEFFLIIGGYYLNNLTKDART